MSSSSLPLPNPFRQPSQRQDGEGISETMVRGSAASTNASEGASRYGINPEEDGNQRRPNDRSHDVGSQSGAAENDATSDESSESSAEDSDASPAVTLTLPSAYFGGLPPVATPPPRSVRSDGSPQNSAARSSSRQRRQRQMSSPIDGAPSSSGRSGQDGVRRLVLLAKHPNADEEQIQRVLMKQRRQQDSSTSTAVRKSQLFRQQQEQQELQRQGHQQQPDGLRVAFQPVLADDERERRSLNRRGLGSDLHREGNGSFGDATNLSPHRNMLRHPSLSQDGYDDEDDSRSFAFWESAGQGTTGETILPPQEGPSGHGAGQGVSSNNEETTTTENANGNSTSLGIFGLAIDFVGKILPSKSPPSVLPSTASIASDFDGRSTTTAFDNKSLASRLSVPSYSSEQTRKINNLSLQNPSGINNPTCREGESTVGRQRWTRKGTIILTLTLILVIALIVTLAAAIGGKKKGNGNSSSSSSSSEDAGSLPALRLPPSYLQSVAPSMSSSPTTAPMMLVPTLPPVQEGESPFASTDSVNTETTPPETFTPASTENGTILTGAPSASPTIPSGIAPGSAPVTPAPTALRPTSAPANMPTLSSPASHSPTSSMLPFEAWTWTDKGQVLKGNQADQQFGQSVALSKDGNMLAIGAPYSSVNGLSQAGMVQIFQWNDETQLWSPFGLLLGRNTDDQFGSSVALSADGNVLAVSEPTFDGKAGDRSGNVRVFINGPFNGFSPLGQELEGDDATDYSGIGLSLSSNGRRLAVGEPYHDNTNDNGDGNSTTNGGSSRLVSGQAKIYEWSVEENEWVAVVAIPLQGMNHLDWFGWSLSLNDDGSFLCVGAPRNLEFGGYVQCFEETKVDNASSEWQLIGGTIRNELLPIRYDDSFGHVIKVSHDATGLKPRIAIGAPGKNRDALDSGIVVVMEFSFNQWSQLGDVVVAENPGIGNQMGMSVDLQGDLLAVGIPGTDNVGQVNIYHLDPATENAKQEWRRHPHTFQGPEGSNYGVSVQLTADGTIVVGCGETGDDNNGGMVNVYRRENV